MTVYCERCRGYLGPQGCRGFHLWRVDFGDGTSFLARDRQTVEAVIKQARGES